MPRKGFCDLFRHQLIQYFILMKIVIILRNCQTWCWLWEWHYSAALKNSRLNSFLPECFSKISKCTKMLKFCILIEKWIEFARNTQSWQNWYFCTTSNGKNWKQLRTKSISIQIFYRPFFKEKAIQKCQLCQLCVL